METMASDADLEEAKARSPVLSNRPTRRSARNSRVHFDGILPVNPDEETHPIVVESMFEEHHKTVGVYLGFLQEDHKYEVKFKIPLENLVGFISIRLDDPMISTSEPTHCVIKETQFVEGRYLEIATELQIRNLSNFEDKFTLQSESEPHRFVHVRLYAQILGKGMGTPMLKNGIKCTGVPPEDDSVSDISIAD